MSLWKFGVVSMAFAALACGSSGSALDAGVNSDGGQHAGAGCATLKACCPNLPASQDPTECLTVADEGTSEACGISVAAYQTAGLCVDGGLRLPVMAEAGTSALGSMCIGSGNGADGLACCATGNDDCTGDYDCCGGSCMGGACTSIGSDCTASLGSRCTTPESCSCTTDSDCCQQATGAICSNSTVTTSGQRCCLMTGTSCGGDGDCCSGSCDTAQACD
jgi:hypothetical protein